jgi:hypothetical protein
MIFLIKNKIMLESVVLNYNNRYTNIIYRQTFPMDVISMYNAKQKQVDVDDLVLFNKYFIDKNISYKKGVFTFNECGVYSINFSLYIEKLEMPSADILVDCGDDSFTVSAKGIDDISTAHSMVIPCSFTKKFHECATLKLKNVSTGDILLMPNYNDSIGSIISIYNVSQKNE